MVRTNMGSIATTLFMLSMLFLSVPWAATFHVHEKTFLKCMSGHSSRRSKILRNVYTRKSSEYMSLLEFASQNPRWINETYGRPFAIVAPVKENDIWTTIRCSKRLKLQVRVKSGGHDYEGLSVRAKSLFVMIDLVNLKSININLKHKTAWIQAGVTLGQLYYHIGNKSRTHAFPGGLGADVGSGGHISGGGFGTLLRKHGLAADNVLDARFMDVKGRILDRSTMGEELFWALRGGGGASFGVILAWKLKLVQVPEQVTVFAFRRRLDPKDLSLLHKWQNTAHKLPRDIFIRILVQNLGSNVPGDEKFVQVTYNGMFLGPAAQLVKLLRKQFPEFDLHIEDCFQAPLVDGSCTDRPCIKKECYQVPWIQSAVFFSGKKPDQPAETLLSKAKNKRVFNKATSDFLKVPIPEMGWKMIHNMFLSEERPIIIIDPLGGKMDKIAENETAFPHRKGNLFNVQYMINWFDDNRAQVADKHIAWMRSFHKKMAPYVAKSPRTAYINYKDLDLGKNDEDYSYHRGKVWGEKYFKGNFERLARIKGKIDPRNFFRNEQSIPVFAVDD
ncbi:cannabidiolic acid synthase-like 2-like [Dorcoceras hygrometricum]|uniref:Cannabidiolic acid synthase-like 2-like n=1 Tax=Dorcoceras hygrometricum TaxID=472368 RepID=A0A2Z7DD69_9LAMI|nr:cannabidiolic acid synthase-like 2-like [Dorcoceras hygrometricum]